MGKYPSRISLNLEDILNHPDLPEGHHDNWGHLHIRLVWLVIVWIGSVSGVLIIMLWISGVMKLSMSMYNTSILVSLDMVHAL